MPPAAGGHGSIAQNLGTALLLFVKQHHLGEVLAAETGFRLAGLGDPKHNVYAPDVSFVRAERVPGRDTPAWATFGSWRPIWQWRQHQKASSCQRWPPRRATG